MSDSLNFLLFIALFLLLPFNSLEYIGLNQRR
jgi:hypothetical protein